jgi:hypothetical protein
MPRTRKVVEGVPTPPPESCGHINLHAFDALGKHPICSLPKGHDGNHHGKYMRRYVDNKYEGKRLISQTHRDEVRETEWSDGAGKMPEVVEDTRVPLMAQVEFLSHAPAALHELDAELVAIENNTRLKKVSGG